MKKIVGAGFALVVLALPAMAEDAKPVTVTPIAASQTTASGQPITFPPGDLAFTASAYDIAAGAALPEHKHPFPRYAYVLAGTIAVTNTVTGETATYKAGDVIIEAVDQWHKAKNIGGDVVKLIVYDFAPKGAQNTVKK